MPQQQQYGVEDEEVDVEAEEKPPVMAVAVVDPADLELVEGATVRVLFNRVCLTHRGIQLNWTLHLHPHVRRTQVMVMHRPTGQPLALLTPPPPLHLSWTRVHLRPAYWGGTGSPDDNDAAAFVAREEPLPGLEGKGLYTPSCDDHGCLLAVRVASAAAAAAAGGNGASQTRRLLTARPVALDARVEKAVRAALAGGSWVCGHMCVCV